MKNKAIRFLIYIIIIIVVIIIVSTVSTSIRNMSIEAKGYKLDTVEYAIMQELQFKQVDINRVKFKYQVEGNYMIVLVAELDNNGDTSNQLAFVGRIDNEGNYNFEMNNADKVFPMVPFKQDIIAGIIAYKYNGQYVFLYQVNNVIDFSKVQLNNLANKNINKLSIDGTDAMVFYDIVDQLTPNYIITAKYDGDIIPINDYDNISLYINILFKEDQ